MKKNEIALIILIVSIAAAASYFLVGALLPTPEKNKQMVEVVEPIETSVVPPSPEVFSKEAINPTVKIKIGDQSNQQPFTIDQ